MSPGLDGLVDDPNGFHRQYMVRPNAYSLLFGQNVTPLNRSSGSSVTVKPLPMGGRNHVLVLNSHLASCSMLSYSHTSPYAVKISLS
jgi:hypothetical protein